MRTIGVDLAAEARGTALAAVEWTPPVAAVSVIVVGVDDRAVLAAGRQAAAIGVDCPLGWPVAFVEFVRDHAEGRTPAVDPTDAHWRRRLALRETDLACVEFTRSRTGRAVRPLSVSADLLGHAAMRCAVLQDLMRAAGIAVDRAGVTGPLAEVHPAASLALWGVSGPSYKGRARRESLSAALHRLRAAAPWLRWSEDAVRACAASDHAFDAVVAALSARAVALRRATAPATAAQLALARVEGWIALPTCSLDELPADPGDLERRARS